MLRIIAYDIANTKRLVRIANVCLDYGWRLEKSVFECDLDNGTFEKFWRRLTGIADVAEDSLVVIPVCGDCEKRILTLGRHTVRHRVQTTYVF